MTASSSHGGEASDETDGFGGEGTSRRKTLTKKLPLYESDSDSSSYCWRSPFREGSSIGSTTPPEGSPTTSPRRNSERPEPEESMDPAEALPKRPRRDVDLT